MPRIHTMVKGALKMLWQIGQKGLVFGNTSDQKVSEL